MTCFHMKKIWVRKSRTIDFNELSEQEQKYQNKISWKPRKGYRMVEIPCGNCIGCKLDRADDWATRITLEQKTWKNNWFVTLTYNQENLPENEELNKKHIQDFMKRLRYYNTGAEEWENPKTQKIEKPIRYFVCGEYGDKKGRPHYHMALFNLEIKDLKLYKQNKMNTNPLYTSKKLQKIWGKGFVIIGRLEYKSASYIARYCQKKAGIEPKRRIYEYDNEKCTRTIKKDKNQKTAEFIQMSTGIGIGRIWWEKNKKLVKETGNILIKIGDNVKAKRICKYFKKLWEKEDWQSYEVYKYERQKQAVIDKLRIISEENYNIKKPEINYTKLAEWKQNVEIKNKRNIREIEEIEKDLKTKIKQEKTILSETEIDQKWKEHLKKQENILKQKSNLLKRTNFV